jgi:hypothetical protein
LLSCRKEAGVGKGHRHDGEDKTHQQDDENRPAKESAPRLYRRLDDLIAFFVHGRLLSDANRQSGCKVPNLRHASAGAASAQAIGAQARRAVADAEWRSTIAGDAGKPEALKSEDRRRTSMRA